MDKKDSIRILVVSSKYPPEYAGSGLRAHKTYRRISSKYGFRYKVLCGSVIFNRTQRYLHEGACVYRIACKLFRNVKSTEEMEKGTFLQRLIRKVKSGVNYLAEASLTWIYLFKYGSQFDLIHIFGNNYVTGTALTYARITRKPLILEFCNISQNFRLYEPWFIKAMFGRALPPHSKAVCISERAKEMCLRAGYTDKIWCRPNPVDKKIFFVDKKNKLSHRKKLRLFNERDIILVNIGKIYPLKNQIFLIEVLKGLPEAYKLVIAGPLLKSDPYAERDSAYFNTLRARIKDYGLGERVRLECRFLDNIDEYIKASDIYLLASKIEACATPVIEALACGIPVVANRIEGVTTEWIKEGISGYLSTINDVEAFREKVAMAASLDKVRLEESVHGIISKASSERVDEEYVKSINELLKRG